MGYDEHKHISPRNVNCAVIIVSDSRTLKTDESGKLICELLQEAGHTVSSFDLLKNDAGVVRAKLNEIFNTDIQLVITSGGTGASSRDLTVETVGTMLEIEVFGADEADATTAIERLFESERDADDAPRDIVSGPEEGLG